MSAQGQQPKDPFGFLSLPFIVGSDVVPEATRAARSRAYFHALTGFLKEHHAIHATHPEDFFTILFPQSQRCCPHNGSIDETRRLCLAFNTLLRDDMEDIGALARCMEQAEIPVDAQLSSRSSTLDEPSASSILHRKMRSATPELFCFMKEAVSLHLNYWPSRVDGRSIKNNSSLSLPLEQQLLSLMSRKKSHEVHAMRAAILELVQKACSVVSDPMNGRPRVDTVLNIGEGKGYLSTALALVDGFQVIGLDCNVQHKEAREANLEKILAKCATVPDAATPGNDDACNRDAFQRQRGNLVAITCKVDSALDVASVLQPHVEVCHSGIQGCDISHRECATEDPPAQCLSKLECKVCHTVLRRSIGRMLHHVRAMHLRNARSLQSTPPRQCTATSELQDVSLFSESDFQRLIAMPGNEIELHLLQLFRDFRGGSDEAEVYPRGTRLILPPGLCEQQSSCSSRPGSAGGDGVHSRNVVTVLGHDAASGSYKLFHHGTKSKIRLSLSQTSCIRVVPEPQPVAMPVRSDLANVALVGLHPCGDLGADICRLFVRYTSCQVCIFASCCWHALTSSGYPLSESLRTADIYFPLISRMLATMPHARWVSASGYRDGQDCVTGTENCGLSLDSLRLLFHRAMFQELVVRLHSNCPSLATLKVRLSPSITKKLSSHKKILTFVNFAELVWGISSAEPAARIATAKAKIVECACGITTLPGTMEVVVATAAQLEHELVPKYFKAFVGLSLLRSWVAPLVETLFLLDRCLFLCESSAAGKHPTNCSSNVDVRLVPIFDPVVSPRNYVIAAFRV